MDMCALRFEEHPDNPLVQPVRPGWMIADPTVLLPEETGDGRWLMLANAIPPRIHRYRSADGVKWEREGSFGRGCMRPFVRYFEGRYHLYTEEVRRLLPLRSRIVHRVSTDLVEWSEPTPVLEPSLPWHGRVARTVGNPCVVPWQGEWRLYYSAATVWLRDCGFVEPRFIGVARGPSPAGPFAPDREPLFAPHAKDPFMNLGAGALKVVVDPDGEGLWAFHNGITRDGEGRSRSAIELLHARDGEHFLCCGDPILAPGGNGWKKALVYALDARILSDRSVYLYFNARSGWLVGQERIGLAVGRA